MKSRINQVFFALSLLIIFVGFDVCFAETVVSAQDGNWYSAETWQGKSVPVAGDIVVIVHKVALNDSVEGRIDMLAIAQSALFTVEINGKISVGRISNNGEIINSGMIEIAEATDADAKIPNAIETKSDGRWVNGDTWRTNSEPKTGDIVVINNNVVIDEAIRSVPQMIIVNKSAKLTIKKDAAVVTKQLVNFGEVNNEGVISICD